MSDKHDLYPELPVRLPDGLPVGKKQAEAQYRVMEFLTQRPAGEQWAHGMEVCEAVQRINPRISFGNVYCALDRLHNIAHYLETKFEPSEREGRGRRYYRATSDGTRAYDNSKDPSRQPLPMPKHKPAPAFG